MERCATSAAVFWLGLGLGMGGCGTEVAPPGPKDGDRDGDGWADSEDCGVHNPGIHPGADEHCDGVDEDCDGEVDERAVDEVAVYPDADRDGYAARRSTETTCEPAGRDTAPGGDCDDTDPSIHPGARELCDPDGVDRDCDGLVGTEDDDLWGADRCWVDADGDGQGAAGPRVPCCDPDPGFALNNLDCDDTDPAAYTGPAYRDADRDGFGVGAVVQRCTMGSGWSRANGDCDDRDPSTHPGAAEICGDGADNNCDGDLREGDADGDGWLDCEDCLSSNPTAFPGAPELCNGLDDDCDGAWDDDPVDLIYGWADRDADGYAGPTESWACTYAIHDAPGIDCDDEDHDVSPAREERCSTPYDDDCDGLVNEAYAVWCRELQPDDDGDGYGDGSEVRLCACEGGPGTATRGGDCDPTHATVHPGAVEDCTTPADEDCDGSPDCPTPALVPVSWGDGEGAYGRSFSFSGDEDGDGEPELWALADANGERGAGAVWGRSGHLGGLPAEPWAVAIARYRYGPEPMNVLAVGDTDGDGFTDLVGASPGASLEAHEEGGVFILPGPAPSHPLDWETAATLRGSAYRDQAGVTLAVGGDIDGDGLPDVLAGMVGESRHETAQICVLPGAGRGPGLLSDSACLYGGRGYTGNMVWSFTASSDLDGDGVADLFLDGRERGELDVAYAVEFGPIAEDVSVDAMDLNVTTRCFDTSFADGAVLTDLRGDGLPDLWLATAGHLKVYDEVSAFSTCAGPSLSLPRPEDVDITTLVAGDRDGDGELDLIGSSDANSGSRRGIAGWRGPLPWEGVGREPDLLIRAGEEYEYLGEALQVGPDFDGDGVEDLYVWSLTSPLVDGSPGVISVLPSGRLW